MYLGGASGNGLAASSARTSGEPCNNRPQNPSHQIVDGAREFRFDLILEERQSGFRNAHYFHPERLPGQLL